MIFIKLLKLFVFNYYSIIYLPKYGMQGKRNVSR